MMMDGELGPEAATMSAFELLLLEVPGTRAERDAAAERQAAVQHGALTHVLDEGDVRLRGAGGHRADERGVLRDRGRRGNLPCYLGVRVHKPQPMRDVLMHFDEGANHEHEHEGLQPGVLLAERHLARQGSAIAGLLYACEHRAHGMHQD